MMPKGDTIAAIMKLNPTADPAFLAEFSTKELSDYLRRLSNVPDLSTATGATDRTHPDPPPAQGADSRSGTFSISSPGISYP
jgi:hypothetical protein